MTRNGATATSCDRADAGAGCSRRPATVTCELPRAVADNRSSTASITWVATVRPKRDSHTCASGASSSMIVPAAVSSGNSTCSGSLSHSSKVSSGSSRASFSTSIRMEARVWPGSMVKARCAAR